jgi:hypothetical protein
MLMWEKALSLQCYCRGEQYCDNIIFGGNNPVVMLLWEGTIFGNVTVGESNILVNFKVERSNIVVM